MAKEPETPKTAAHPNRHLLQTLGATVMAPLALSVALASPMGQNFITAAQEVGHTMAQKAGAALGHVLTYGDQTANAAGSLFPANADTMPQTPEGKKFQNAVDPHQTMIDVKLNSTTKKADGFIFDQGNLGQGGRITLRTIYENGRVRVVSNQPKLNFSAEIGPDGNIAPGSLKPQNPQNAADRTLLEDLGKTRAVFIKNYKTAINSATTAPAPAQRVQPSDEAQKYQGLAGSNQTIERYEVEPKTGIVHMTFAESHMGAKHNATVLTTIIRQGDDMAVGITQPSIKSDNSLNFKGEFKSGNLVPGSVQSPNTPAGSERFELGTALLIDRAAAGQRLIDKMAKDGPKAAAATDPTTTAKAAKPQNMPATRGAMNFCRDGVGGGCPKF